MIVLRRVTKTYPGNVTALSEVSLAIPQGDFVFLVGPNGAGKTTLFKLMIREERPTSGCILFDGTNVGEMNQKRLSRHRRQLGAVFQDARLLPAKTVFENVALPLQADGLKPQDVRERTEACLFLTSLEPLQHRFPHDLSGGQRQQVAIARALVNRPDVILADEPTGNLSPSATDKIMHLLSVINGCNITVVVATHGQDIVDSMGKRVMALDRGRLVIDTAQGAYPEFLRTAA